MKAMSLVLVTLLSSSALVANETKNNIIPENHYKSAQTSTFKHNDTTLQKMERKTGFLTSQSCAQAGVFKDCSLEKRDSEALVMYVHNENKIYKVVAQAEVGESAFDPAYNRAQVQLFGKTGKNGEFIVAGLSAPKRAKVEQFKGCM